jgi:hypothetical protein
MASTFAIKRSAVLTTFVVGNLLVHVACQAVSPVTDVRSTTPLSAVAFLPLTVNRLAIWYPRTSEKEVAYGYARLSQAVFEGKKHRPWLKILERRDIGIVNHELALQHSGRVADETAISIGRMLGADSVALFQIESPTWRDRMFARIQETMPPITILSKVLSVESGEVLYHNIVASHPLPASGRWEDYASDHELQAHLHSALTNALTAAVQHIEQSFQRD